MKKLSTIAFLIIQSLNGLTQNTYNVSFKDSVQVITRSKTENVYIPVFLTAALGSYRNDSSYKVIVQADFVRSTLPQSQYQLELNEKAFVGLSETDNSLNKILLTIKKDTVFDQPKILALSIQVKKGNTVDSSNHNSGVIKNFMLKINSINDSYEISFVTLQPISRSKTGDVICPVYLKANIDNAGRFNSYKVKVFPDLSKSTLPATEYKIDPGEKSFSDLSSSDSSLNVIYLTVKKDSLEDRTRNIILKLNVKNGDSMLAPQMNKGLLKTLSITVNGVKPNDSLKAYNYLAYVGTNFDLVDGPKAKNLFFASNIFLPPSKPKSVGLYLSLYGNRTMTTTDTAGDVVHTTRIVEADTITKTYTEQATLIRTQVSDNLGAYISPLIRIKGTSSRESTIQLYYSPSLEFVWRRTNVTSTYSNGINKDSSISRGSGSKSVIDYSNSSTGIYNEFVFNVGLIGLTVVHESKDISVRVHCSTGYSSSYSPISVGLTKGSLNGPTPSIYNQSGDIFFCGRAWITEAVTGITLEAEITNNLNHPRPFYGVTLSKAINFQNLGKIFQPIVAR